MFHVQAMKVYREAEYV